MRGQFAAIDYNIYWYLHYPYFNDAHTHFPQSELAVELAKADSTTPMRPKPKGAAAATMEESEATTVTSLKEECHIKK